MTNHIRYTHTNIIAKDWRKLAKFYTDVFGCEPKLPERDLSGNWIDDLTGINNVNLRGMHLSLPGVEGVTIEIFEYTPSKDLEVIKDINSYGFGHLAFHVDDVTSLVDEVLENGGQILGKIIEKDYGELGILTAAYVRDPEGNFIEIQNWQKTS